MLIQKITELQPFLDRHADDNPPALSFLQRDPQDLPSCILQATVQYAGPLPNGHAADIHLAELHRSGFESMHHPKKRHMPQADYLVLVVEPSSPMDQYPSTSWLPPQDAFRCATRIPFSSIAQWYGTTHRAFVLSFEGITILSAVDLFWNELRSPLTTYLASHGSCRLWPTTSPRSTDSMPVMPPDTVDRVPLIDFPCGTTARVACFEGGTDTASDISAILALHLSADLRADTGDFPQPMPYREPTESRDKP